MNKATYKTGVTLALVAIALLVVVPTVYGQRIGLESLERLTAGTPQQIERGEDVYDVQCAECHGDEGLGGAPIGEEMGAEGFVDTDVEYSGIKSIYSVITHGQVGDEEHPVFENIRYQDRFAAAAYVNSLVDDPRPDSPELVEQIRQEAQEGRCDPAILDELQEGLDEFAEPEDAEQIDQGQEAYDANCQACHGADGRGQTPDARDFHDDPDDWVHSTTPTGIYRTLEEGIPDTNMQSFADLPEEQLWAMAHYLREELLPEDSVQRDEQLQEAMEDELFDLCRSESAPPDPDPISIEQAMEFMAEDYEAGQQRFIRYHQYGDPVVEPEADPVRGQEIYQQSCASCHGAEGRADEALGPYGKFPPYMYIEIDDLVPASVGGTYEDVARRVLEGPHAPLPNRPSVATLTDRDWQDLQYFIASFEGEGRDRVRTARQFETVYEINDLTIVTTAEREDFDALQAWFEDSELSAEQLEELLDDAGVDAQEVEADDLQLLEEAFEDEEQTQEEDAP